MRTTILKTNLETVVTKMRIVKKKALSRTSSTHQDVHAHIK